MTPRNEGWQPIATAPMDGTVVLICGGSYEDDTSMGGPYPFIGYSLAFCDGVPPIGADTHPWCGERVTRDEFCWHAPTHWMPLPAPPETGE